MSSTASLGVANPQMPISPPISEKEVHSTAAATVTKEFDSPIRIRAGLPSWDDMHGNPHFKIGVIVDKTSTFDQHIPSIAKPATPCSLASVVVLHPQETEDREASMKEWFLHHRMQGTTASVRVGWGRTGLDELLKDSDVDAVYIIVPPGSQREYVLEALQSGKHVLLNDPISTSMNEFMEQQTLAKKYGKFIQFSTMFVHQFQVLRFINLVLNDARFGLIHRIDASLHVCYDDIEKVGIKLPLKKGDSSIRVLGRFCVLVSTLFYAQMGCLAESAKIENMELGENGEVTAAKCIVKYSGGRVLYADFSFTQGSTSRQSIRMEAGSRFATMNDFVFEHPDGLATYRIYETAPKINDHIEVTTGESIDLAGGPPQNTILWRTFVNLCHSLDQQGGWDQSDETKECRVLANIALQLKRVLIALSKSAENSYEEVVIDDIDYQ